VTYPSVLCTKIGMHRTCRKYTQ